MSNIIIRSKLFYIDADGALQASWYLGNADGTSVAKQNYYIRVMDKWGANTIFLNILNDTFSTIYSGEFMNSSFHEGKVNLYFNFMRRLKNAGKLVVPVFFDCPRGDSSAKYPYWIYGDRLVPFLRIVTKALAPLADGYVLGIETHRGPTITDQRGLSTTEVNAALGVIKKYAYRVDNEGVRHNIPVGTHEVGDRMFSNADFKGVETRNHPVTQGDSTPVADMVAEVSGIAKRAQAAGQPVIVMESNSSEGAQAKAQNQAMAQIDGVVGVNCPM